MSSYPKWIFHPEHPAKIVHSPAEHAEHSDWKEAPVVADSSEPGIDASPEKPRRGRKPKAISSDSPEVSE